MSYSSSSYLKFERKKVLSKLTLSLAFHQPFVNHNLLERAVVATAPHVNTDVTTEQVSSVGVHIF